MLPPINAAENVHPDRYQFIDEVVDLKAESTGETKAI